MECCKSVSNFDAKGNQPLPNGKKGKVIIISGPSGSGKGSVIHCLTTKYDNYTVAIRATTRISRPGEGDYIFMSNEEFELGIQNSKFLEHSCFCGKYSGVLKETVESIITVGKNAIIDEDLSSALRVKKHIPDAILVWINAVNVDQLVEALSARNLNESAQLARLSTYERDLYDGLKADILLINNEPQATAEKLDGIIRNQALARDIYEENVECTVDLKKEISRYLKRRKKEPQIIETGNISTLYSLSPLENITPPETVFVPNLQGDIDIYFERLLKIEKMLAELTKTANDTNSKVTSLKEFVETDLQKWLQEEKKAFIVSAQYIEDDSLIEQFAHKVAEYINLHIHASDQQVYREENHLKSVFGTTWNKLLSSTKSSLISAGVLWELCADISVSGFDYSGIIIAATSALESEIKRFFYSGFRDYLLQKNGDPQQLEISQVFALWPERFLSLSSKEYNNLVIKRKKPTVELVNDDKFTMGMLPFMFDDKEKQQRLLLQKNMDDYLKTIFKNELDNPMDVVYSISYENGIKRPHPNCFVGRCEDIRTKYRNPAGHVDVLSRKSAEECYSKIVGKVDAFRFTYEIEGLIMMLYSYIK